MTYVKRVPPIKLVLTVNEYNILIGVLTENIDEQGNENIRELANITKEKLLKYSLPRTDENDALVQNTTYLHKYLQNKDFTNLGRSFILQ